MSRRDNIPLLQRKAQDLVLWFEWKQIPASPFVLRQGEKCLDAEHLIFVTLLQLVIYYQNPYDKLFVNAYKRLADIKKYIECSTN